MSFLLAFFAPWFKLRSDPLQNLQDSCQEIANSDKHGSFGAESLVIPPGKTLPAVPTSKIGHVPWNLRLASSVCVSGFWDYIILRADDARAPERTTPDNAQPREARLKSTLPLRWTPFFGQRRGLNKSWLGRLAARETLPRSRADAEAAALSFG
jgi:hypothetical protein